jgi:homogentisate 1,2-dioxygenase
VNQHSRQTPGIHAGAAPDVTTSGYMSGFGNSFETEAIPGALPIGRNSPQQCNFGLYAEQLSGSAFTAPRATNQRSWLYRIRPTVAHWGDFERVDGGQWETAPIAGADVPLGPLRWAPTPIPERPLSFIEGISTISATGDHGSLVGMAAHIYVASRAMDREYFYNADGEMLLVPQQGALTIQTEFGILDVGPGEIAVIPRGVKISIAPADGVARGFICENYGSPFTLPDRGLIGANGLANPRDFLTPVAAYEDRAEPCQLYVKWGGSLWRASLDRSPLDVVAWHGNYAPYKYDLRRFSPVGSILFDHPDPSIFTVLTSASERPGVANVDFVLFSDRWLVAEDTFRPPWYHMNVMSEFMGMIHGKYDAKPGGFAPGSFSLHNSMLPHGPDVGAFEAARTEALVPRQLQNTMAFMFEACFPQKVTAFAAGLPQFDEDYLLYGSDLKTYFDSRGGPKS